MFIFDWVNLEEMPLAYGWHIHDYHQIYYIIVSKCGLNISIISVQSIFYDLSNTDTTRAGLRSPEEVFNTSPTVALYAKKEGESQPAEAIECELFMLPEQYLLSGIYHDQDGVRLEAANQESADVLRRHLRDSGWTVTASTIWPKYSFASLLSLSKRFTPEQIVAGLIMRNPELPPGVCALQVEKDPRRGRPGHWFGWTSTRTQLSICVR